MDEVVKWFWCCGNVMFLISIEGFEIISDEWCGWVGVYSVLMNGIENCLKNKVMIGVCMSLC